MKAGKDTAFTVELLGLFILLIMVITIISSVFVMSRAHSLQARRLTEAVILAGNTAEAASASPDNDSLADALINLENCMGHTCKLSELDEPDAVSVLFGAKLDSGDTAGNDTFLVRITRTYEYGAAAGKNGGAYAGDVIEIFDTGGKDPGIGTSDEIRVQDLKDTDPVYTLNAGTYFGAESPARKGGGS